MAAAILVMTLVGVKLLTQFYKTRGCKWPPGPWGVPLLGYLPFFGKEPHLTFTKLRKTYGDVVSIGMGSWPAIVISGRDVIREALVTQRDNFSGRPPFTTARMVNGGRSLGLGPFGPLWEMHHAVVRNVMSRFASPSNNTLIEDIVHSEVDTVIKNFTARGEDSFSPKDSMSVAASSMISQLCYGRNQDTREDQSFVDELASKRSVSQFKKGNLLDVMPWLRFVLPHKISQFKELVSAIEGRRAGIVAEHEATFDGTDPRDLAEWLIRAGNTLSAEEQAAGLDKRRVVETLDFLRQAQGTVASTLEWFLLLMAAYPEVQDKVSKEIRDVVGGQSGRRLPRLADRSKMPYVEATIAEVMRFASPVPLAIPHTTTCHTKLQGFDIPEGTVVLVNLYSIYMDEDVWGDPGRFRPERFLGGEGEVDKGLVEQVSTFSLGRRRCTGELLACKELFLFVSTLMQRLQIRRPPGHPEYSMDGYYSPTRKPDPFEICTAAARS